MNNNGDNSGQNSEGISTLNTAQNSEQNSVENRVQRMTLGPLRKIIYHQSIKNERKWPKYVSNGPR